jgi:TatD DNase family protein
MSVMPLSWIDTHVHWGASEFDSDRDLMLKRARAVGVTHCINPAVSVTDFNSVHQLAELSKQRPEWPRILPAFGIHPCYVMAMQAGDLEILEHWLQTKRPLAVGEIGLDHYDGAPDFEIQQRIFESQLCLASRYELPVIIHLRHAVEAVIQSIQRIQGRGYRLSGGAAHAFNGSPVQAEKLIEMGFVLGFGGSCTYQGSRRIRRLVESLPLSAIVLETDAPDMAPAWLRGERNDSSQLTSIGAVVAKLKNISMTDLSEQTRQNVERVFMTHQDGANSQSVNL